MIKAFFIINILALITGFFIDCVIGDPVNFPHTICMIGNKIKNKEIQLRNKFGNKNLKKSGAKLVMSVITTTAITVFLVVFLAKLVNIWLYYIVCSLMCWQIIATKSLKIESEKVYTALKEGTLEQARYAVSMIVGRDTQYLDRIGITKATIETVAENTSDGVIAPMLYCFIGGPILGYIYKAINTMDSMVGYKNEKYIEFGYYAAKLDDIANYLPARISAFLMITASFFINLNTKNAYKIWKRDKRKHQSPNSAQTESVCAGALEIQLAGDAVYGGVILKKEFIGDDIKNIEYTDILKANKLMYASTILLITIAIAMLLVITYCL